MSVCRSNQAARWLRDNGGTLQQAADHFGLSFQSVSWAWHRLGFGRVPTAQRRISAIELLREGQLSPKTIAACVGLSRVTVYRLARQNGGCR